MLKQVATADFTGTTAHRQRVIAGEPGQRDIAAATSAAAAFLLALGVDTSAEHLRDTPLRMARAYEEMLSPRDFDLTVFPNDDGYKGLVVTGKIPFNSLCEHHILPFFGGAYVGYLPGEQVVGISKLARVVEMFTLRPQTQERMTQEIARWLTDNLDARGIGVMVQAEHLCMTQRGAKSPGSMTMTAAWDGLLEDPSHREEFEYMIKLGQGAGRIA
ncbi:GTP cyclohydrolase I [Nocardia tengchongensis]|uniref:GTP cyclohydrolase I n=1 Tax=Nocardia tengchongensis TaxID=2055889 RepID=UPI0036754BEB